MQKLISKYGLAAHLAILAVASLFLYPVYVFWLSGLAAIWLFMEPSRIQGEKLHEARKRLTSGMRRDPFFWMCLLLVVYSGVTFWNVGVARAYDAELGVWSISKPMMALMPGSVDGFGAPEFACSVAFLVIVQACRHALGRSARLAFCLCASALAGCGAGVMAVLFSMGDVDVRALAQVSLTCPSFMGSAFGACLLMGIVSLVAAYERKWLKVMLLTIPAIGGNVVGLFMFAPAMVQVVYAAAAILLLAYSFVYSRRRLPGSGEFKFLVTFLTAIAVGVVLVMAVMPKSMIDARIDPYLTGKFFTEQFKPVRDALSEIALKAWKGYPWLGTGLGSFNIDFQFYGGEADWVLLDPKQVSPLNGFWHLLVERGIVGAAFLACTVGFLLWTYGFRLYKGTLAKGATRRMPHPATQAGLLAVAALIVESLVDISFTLPGMMLIVGSMLALAARFFPVPKEEKREDG